MLLPQVMFHLGGRDPSHPVVSAAGPLTFSAWSRALWQRRRRPALRPPRERGEEARSAKSFGQVRQLCANLGVFVGMKDRWLV